MKITGFERTILRVPFLPGILPSIEYGEFGPPDDPFKPELYPRSVGDRYQDLLRIHTDSNAIGIGMGSPYFHPLANPYPDWLGHDPLGFEPRDHRDRRPRHHRMVEQGRVGEDVKEGERAHEHFVRRITERVETGGLLRIDGKVRMGKHRALGRAGGPPRILEERERLRIDRRKLSA